MLELLIGSAILAGGYKLAKTLKERRDQIIAQGAALRAAQLTHQRAASAVRWRQTQTDAAKRTAARNLQIAIQQLSQSPDFRRAASFATHAATAGVPADFRQRQFRRLRAHLVNHLAQRLALGASLETAAAGLRELVGGLGVAPYEADYIATEAQGRQRPATQTAPNYRDRLRQLHAEHAQRIEAIRDTPDLEAEVREQLLEAEHERFRRELLDEPEERR